MIASMTQTPPHTSYSKLLRRGWPWIVLGTVAGLFIGALYLAVLSAQYTSTSSVLVSPTGVRQATAIANARTNSDINLDTEVRLVRSSDVAARVKTLLNTQATPVELLGAVTVAVPPNTSVLAISFSSAQPEDAQQGAHAFAQAYLASRTASAQNELDDQLKVIKEESDNTTRTLRDVTKKLSGLANGTPARAFSSAERDVSIQQLSSLSQQRTKLSTTVITPGVIVNDADFPVAPAGPSGLLVLMSGAMLGLLAGLGWAALLRRRDHRVYDRGDIEIRLGLPVIAQPGRLSTTSLGPCEGISAEAFRHLVNVLPKGSVVDPTTVLVTSGSAGAVGSCVAANLAAVLAHSGKPTILLSNSADTILPNLLPPRPCSDTDEALRRQDVGEQKFSVVCSDVPGLRTAQQERPNEEAPSWTAWPDDRVAFSALRQESAYLVVNALSTASSAEAQAFADLADAVIVVAEEGRTTEEQLTHALTQFDDVGSSILGIVLIPRIHKGKASPRTKHPQRKAVRHVNVGRRDNAAKVHHPSANLNEDAQVEEVFRPRESLPAGGSTADDHLLISEPVSTTPPAADRSA